MSGAFTRPDWGATIKDLARRIGILERRTTPATARASTGNSHDGEGAFAVVVSNSTGNQATSPANLGIAIGSADPVIEADGGSVAPVASGTGAVAIGSGVHGLPLDNWGFGARAESGMTVAIGTGSQAAQIRDVAIGSGASASSGTGDIQIGPGVAVGAWAGVIQGGTAAFGVGATVVHEGSTAIGLSATSTRVHQVMLGTAAEFVEIPGNGIVLHSPDDSRWRITVSNAGALVVTAA